MDLSKLPRLSETDKQTPPPPPSDASMPSARSAPVQADSIGYATPSPLPGGGISGQVWLSGIIGLLLVMFGWNFARFSIAKLTGQTFHTGVNWTSGEKAGQEVDYFDLQGYTAYTDAGIFLFGLAMVLEAVLLATVRNNTPASRAIVGFTLLVTVLATALNILVVGLLLKTGILPLMSGLAVAYGGYMAAYEWQMLKDLLASARVQPPRA
jgi:hypothetical protein